MGNNQGVIKDYDKAIKLESSFAVAYYNQAFIWERKGNKSKACEDWSKTGELGEQNAYEMIKKYCQ